MVGEAPTAAVVLKTPNTANLCHPGVFSRPPVRKVLVRGQCYGMSLLLR